MTSWFHIFCCVRFTIILAKCSYSPPKSPMLSPHGVLFHLRHFKKVSCTDLQSVFIHLSIHLSVHLSIYPSILSVCQNPYLLMYLSILSCIYTIINLVIYLLVESIWYIHLLFGLSIHQIMFHWCTLMCFDWSPGRHWVIGPITFPTKPQNYTSL